MVSPLPLPKYLREDFLSQECKDLLPTLLSEEGWLGFRIYFYHGFWFLPAHLHGLLISRSNFRAHDNGIIRATFPKSGTTWLKAILFALSRRSMGEDSLLQPNPLLTTGPRELVPFLESNLLDENQNPDLSSFTSMRNFATHMPYLLLPKSIRDSKCKIVYLCRNLKDNFASLWHFTKKLWPKEIDEISLEEGFDKFCRGVCPYGPCWDHILGYWTAGLEFPERVLFLKYEDMKERPVEMVKKLAEFIGCPIKEDGAANEILSMCSFESLGKLEVNKNGMSPFGMESNVFFRKGDVGDWKNLLSPEMANRLDRITEEKLSGFGLKL